MPEETLKRQGVLPRLLGGCGRWGLQSLENVYFTFRLILQSLYWTFVAPFAGKGLRVGSSFDEMVKVGVSAVPIVALISFSIGLILAMQSAYQLEQFGATIFTADLVAVAQTRELGPLMTAIIVAGRSGSGIAAEIGTMKVGEEIDALRSMGFHPIKFLVVPKLIALAIMVPCLTVLADFIGIAGGFSMAVLSLNLGFTRYLNRTIFALVFKDMITGLIKSFVFALLIGLTGCYMGFKVEGGAEGVGRRTTQSVVVSIFLIILADSFFTALFYFLW
ncbi:MAG: ABC transporter permease [Candidatus Glassbacteria bacterium]|nr:ABC transporter permease [Candidatus Glassbacteria bacterium]